MDFYVEISIGCRNFIDRKGDEILGNNNFENNEIESVRVDDVVGDFDLQSSGLFEASYDVSLDDYIDFNKVLLNDVIGHKKKKGYIMGILLIVMSVILGAQTVSSGRTGQHLLSFLIVLVFVMGIYNILFYKKIFPDSFARNAKKMYQTTKYFEDKLFLKVFEDKILEISKDGEFVVDFSSVATKYENEKFLILISDVNKVLVIKKSVLPSELQNFITNKIKK